MEQPRKMNGWIKLLVIMPLLGTPVWGFDLESLKSARLEEREKAAEAIGKEHKALVDGLIKLASEKVEYLPSSSPHHKEYPWHDAKHLSIILLGDLRAVEGIPVLLENIEYKNMKGGEVSQEFFTVDYWFPAAVALSKIGEPSIQPVIEKLGTYSKDGNGRKICLWVLKRVLGYPAAKAKLEAAVAEAHSQATKENLKAAMEKFQP